MQRLRTSGSGARAFTLIELLVVVAIIALLISILLPSLNRAKRQARQLLCVTNLRAQGQAAVLYAEDNKGYLPCAIQSAGRGIDSEYHIYSTAIIEYLGWTGNLGLQLTLQKQVDVVGDSSKLWSAQSPVRPWWRALDLILAEIPQFQCPDYPQGIELTEGQWDRVPDNPLDYVASAFPIPYEQRSLDLDSDADLEWENSGEFQGESTSSPYIWRRKIEDFPTDVSPATLIYVTEAHVSLPWKGGGPRFHHVFLASQLPFGNHPRMANDQRHPGGINGLFFDGHAETKDLHQIDVGYPNFRDKRLRYFTVMPDDWEPAP